MVLFVKLREGLVLDDALIKRIKQTIRVNTTPRHISALVVQVHEMPRIKSNEVVELAALANPEALEEYRQMKNTLEASF